MKIIAPVSIEELLTAKAANPSAVLLAGGTDLLASWHSAGRMPAEVILLNGVKELDFISAPLANNLPAAPSGTSFRPSPSLPTGSTPSVSSGYRQGGGTPRSGEEGGGATGKTPAPLAGNVTGETPVPLSENVAGETPVLLSGNATGETPAPLSFTGGTPVLLSGNVTGETPVLLSEVIEIGATTTHTSIGLNSAIRRLLPALSEAALTIGSPAVRNMGTIGGNIVNASPAADLVPPLIVYDAQLKLMSTRGTRIVPLDRFYKGYKSLDLAADEILFSVIIPVPGRASVARYYKLGTRKALSIAKVSLAGRIEIVNGVVMLVRLAAGSVAPVPLRLSNIEDMLTGRKLTEIPIDQAAERLPAFINPIDDVRSTASYRRFAIGNLLRRLWRDLTEPPLS